MDDKDVLFVNWSHLPLACTQEVDGTVITVSALFGLIFLLGICGNSLVLAVLLQRKPQRLHRSTTNTFILNLSIADLLFLFLCVPFQATIYSLPSWIFGAFLCKCVHYLFTVCMLVSIFTLVTMSIERYIAVVLSHRSLLLRTPRNAQIAVIITWLLSMVIAAPLACYQNLVSGKPYGQPNCSFCWEIWPLWEPSPRRAYKTCVFVLGYLLPLILICCCYTCVLSHLYRKVRNTSRKSERSRRKVG
uniref:G-protein coupled receptors family 1 profile domain-containing protein n=1 Tax=Eptatretus burgeri TaxID=7764 RepID=A0A8C4Q0S0_EPTBU